MVLSKSAVLAKSVRTVFLIAASCELVLRLLGQKLPPFLALALRIVAGRYVPLISRLATYVAVLLPGFLSFIGYCITSRNIIKNIKYAEGSVRRRCDVFLPPAAVRARDAGLRAPSMPVLIFVPGGAWTIAYKWHGGLICRALSAAGVLCVGADYRGWPLADASGMAEDVEAVIEWTIKNCAEYGGDAGRITVMGHSAGAQIGALALLRNAAREYEGVPTQWSNDNILGLVTVAGAFDFTDREFCDHIHRVGLDNAVINSIFGQESERWRCSPTKLLQGRPDLGAHMPPALLTHGTADKLVPVRQSEGFMTALIDSGVADAALLQYEGWGHNDAFLHAPLSGDLHHLRDVVAAICRWSASRSALDDEHVSQASMSMSASTASSCNLLDSIAGTSHSNKKTALLQVSHWSQSPSGFAGPPDKRPALLDVPPYPRWLMDVARFISPF